MTAPVDIAELERLLGAATAGPWQAFIGSEAPQPIYPGVVCFACSPETKAYVVVEDGFVREHEANARLVAALHESAPALLAELKAAREEIDVKAERIAGLERAAFLAAQRRFPILPASYFVEAA